MLTADFIKLIVEFCKLDFTSIFKENISVDEVEVLISNESEQYLRIIFRFEKAKDPIYSFMEYEEEGLNLDHCCNDQKSSYFKLILGEMHILLHPVYAVPTPFLRLWKSNGEILSLPEVLCTLKLNQTNEVVSIDARQYDFGHLTAEDHPYVNGVFYSFHMCMLEERLINIMSSIDASSELYLLNWFSLIGPYMGFGINIQNYEKAKRTLLEQEDNIPFI